MNGFPCGSRRAGAAFFPWRIYYGHSYEVMVQGASESFHAGVRANFMAASGSVQTFADSNELDVSFYARGLTPVDGQAVFAKTQDEIESAYAADGPPVPYAEFDYAVADPPVPQTANIGAGNDATEYWLTYTIGP